MSAKVKVKFVRELATSKKTFKVGDVFEYPKKQAKAVVETRYAEYVQDQPASAK